MKNNNKNSIIPVLLGADLGAYSMARSFAEAGVGKSKIFSRAKLAMTSTSAFVTQEVNAQLDDCDHAVPELIRFKEANRGSDLILVPCADWYMEMLQYARDALLGHYFFMIPNFEVWRTVSDKASFGYILDRYGIPRPKGAVFDSTLSDFFKKGLTLRPPFVVKPSDSSEYYRHKFEGMKKVYFAHSLGEARRIIEEIYSHGYSKKVLLQEYIGGKDAYASVLTVFISSEGTAKRAVLGDVLLEERRGSARGNYSAIITRPLDSVSYKLINMLEGIGYRGFANFDILHDGMGSYCLELNPRLGRSFDYVRLSGMSPASLLISELRGENIKESFYYPEYLWRAVNKRTAIACAENENLIGKAEELERIGAVSTPYDGRRDGGLLRRTYVFTHLLRSGHRFLKDKNRGETL
ncbi:MAG: hypothetical protein IJY18_04730 [Clostridia bacterium]|nr:hypothetical protein [Clostridia bacterium]